jgi:hypothetical protein
MKEGKKYNFDYKPGRTLVELENERLEAALKLSPTERLRKMIQLIRISKKIKQAYTNSIAIH